MKSNELERKKIFLYIYILLSNMNYPDVKEIYFL